MWAGGVLLAAHHLIDQAWAVAMATVFLSLLRGIDQFWVFLGGGRNHNSSTDCDQSYLVTS